jgi:hypothetical protein
LNKKTLESCEILYIKNKSFEEKSKERKLQLEKEQTSFKSEFSKME